MEDRNVLTPFVGPPLPDSFKEYYHFSDDKVGEAVFVFREYYLSKGWLENEPYAGIEEMLKTLKAAGKKLFVATSKPESMARQILRHFGLTGYFEYIGGADENEAQMQKESSRVRKDDVIRYVMEECGIDDKTQVIMVGDRRHDIEGAHKVGISAVGVLYGYGSVGELTAAGADSLAKTPEELALLLL